MCPYLASSSSRASSHGSSLYRNQELKSKESRKGMQRIRIKKVLRQSHSLLSTKTTQMFQRKPCWLAARERLSKRQCFQTITPRKSSTSYPSASE